MMHTMDSTVRIRNFIDSEWLYLVEIWLNVVFYRHKDRIGDFKSMSMRIFIVIYRLHSSVSDIHYRTRLDQIYT